MNRESKRNNSTNFVGKMFRKAVKRTSEELFYAKKLLVVMAAVSFFIFGLSGCGDAIGQETTGTAAVTQTENTETTGEDAAVTQTENAETTGEDAAVQSAAADAVNVDDTVLRVGSLKGPTSMGIVKLRKDSENGETEVNYEFTMETGADVLLAQMVQGDLDIALVPANVAAVLYQKTEGGISVIDINTLGVLYMVSGDSSIAGMQDLSGKTIYLTGKGTTPDYVLQYLLTANGIDLSDVTLEYKSEATEVVGVLAENPDAIGLLPQPFVTVACSQNENLQVVLDMTKEWDAVQGGTDGSRMVTGVTVVTRDYLEAHPGNVLAFMKDHQASAEFANENVSETAEYVAEYGIIEKAPVAEKALPNCNITYIDGSDMKTALSGYLQVLYDQDPTSVGGNLPGDDFYYIYE